MNYAINHTVAAIGDMNFEGNVIPMEWYRHIRFESGNPDMNAILILSDIVYWYRPSAVRDEKTGHLIGYKKKFKADLLQKNYQDYAALFGLSKRQIIDAIVRLEKLGLLRREFRTIETPLGVITNVLFIEIFPSRIKQISSIEGGSTLECETSYDRTGPLPHFNVAPPTIERETYTETTTQITTETSSSSACANEEEEDDESDLNIPQEMIRLWNERVQKDAHPVSLTEQRAIALQTCLKHHFQNNLEQFEAYCLKISQTPFLMGQGANGWKATLDWALDTSHITKVLEGHYFHPKASDELFRAPNNNQQSYSQPIPITDEELNRYGSTWAKVCEKLISELGANTFTSWFRDLVPEQIESANPVLKVPTAFVKDWIKSHHRQAIEQAIQSFNPQFQSLTFSLSDRAGDEE